MKSKTVFAVLMSGASAAHFLAPIAIAEDVASSPDVTASSARPSLEISSEVTPDFLTPVPSVASRAQWQENPLLQPRKNGGAWLENSGVQLLDAPPQSSGFEIEILPAQPKAAPDNLLSRAAKSGDEKFPVQTQQAAKIAVERALLLERAGVPVMAGVQLRRAVALAPRDIASRRALAQWTAQHEQWPEAAAQWREVLYQLRIQSAAPDEITQRELWREEATREMRTAQDHLRAFWQVPNVVTLGADSKNLIAHSTMPTKQPAAITVAVASTALSKVASSPLVSRVVTKVVTKMAVIANQESPMPLLRATPEPRAVPVKSTVENVVAALPNRPSRRELRFDIVITSSSYLRPQDSQNVAFQADDTAKIIGAAKMNEAKNSAPAIAPFVGLDSSREAARLLSMQRQLQPWLGDIVRIGSSSDEKASAR